ncbi:MAG: NAD(+)/NADH kinase [Deltaproteobacteria bacterium]|nr:NAD(+)/NADH kinase [Deltaproteobacteria bacterium]
MKKIGLYVKQDRAARHKADDLEKWLGRRGITVLRKETTRPQLKPGRPTEKKSAPDDLDCLFVLGGDGTFLNASRWAGDTGTPMIGVKFGEVGFLAEIAEESLFAAAESVLRHEFEIRPRMRLDVKIVRNGATMADETVLNDVVINKGALARLATIRAEINGHYLTTYRSDGLIVATPTGSTAYSLAAGGPVIHPAVEGVILTPINPFTLTNRPLIIPDSSKIQLQLGEKASDILVTFDGQAGLEIDADDVLVIEKSQTPLNLIRLAGQHYFDILKTKLRWSGSRI